MSDGFEMDLPSRTRPGISSIALSVDSFRVSWGFSTHSQRARTRTPNVQRKNAQRLRQCLPLGGTGCVSAWRS